MSALYQALNRLESSIHKLEVSVQGVETALAGQQRDMFGAPVNENDSQIDKQAVTQKLDNAISKVESILGHAAQS